MTKSEKRLRRKPNPNWIKKNPEFNSDYIPFPIMLGEADQIFKHYQVVDESVQIIDGICIVTVGVVAVIDGEAVSNRFPGTASRIITRNKSGQYNSYEAATVPAACLSLAIKNALSKFGNRFGRNGLVPDEESSKKEKKFDN